MEVKVDRVLLDRLIRKDDSFRQRREGIFPPVRVDKDWLRRLKEGPGEIKGHVHEKCANREPAIPMASNDVRVPAEWVARLRWPIFKEELHEDTARGWTKSNECSIFSSARFGFKCFPQFVICLLSPLPFSSSSAMSGYNNQKDNEKKGDETSPKSPVVQESDDEADPDAAPSGVNNLLFNIHGTTSQEDYDRLREVFDQLSLDDQLTVALNMEEQMEFAKERLGAIKTSKDVKKEIADSKKVNKEKIDRSQPNYINLNVKVMGRGNGVVGTIKVNRVGKMGQVRKEVCKLFNLRENTPVNMLAGETERKPVISMNVFVYTMGLNEGSTVWVVPPDTPVQPVADNDANDDDGEDDEGEEDEEDDEGEEQDGDETAEQ
eukprot:symbB.v1.2.017434.t1/scaffold1360.1/size203234/5